MASPTSTLSTNSDVDERVAGYTPGFGQFRHGALEAEVSQLPQQRLAQLQHITTQHSQPTPPKRIMGPLSKVVDLPPRAKPGRKAAHSLDGDKRREQNRNAQRRFRDNRTQKMQDMQDAMEVMKRDNEEKLIKLQREMHSAKQEKQHVIDQQQQTINQQQQDIRNLRQSVVALEQRLALRAPAPISMPPPQPRPHNALTPPAELMETDFTYHRPSAQPKSDYGMPMGDDDKCGFCGTGDTCPCSQAPANPVPKATGPGSCAQCQTDPERRRACIAMAETINIDPRDRPLRRNDSNTPTVPCSTVVDAFQSTRASTSSISNLFGAHRMQVFEAEQGGLEFEHAQAAHLLVELNQKDVRKNSQ